MCREGAHSTATVHLHAGDRASVIAELGLSQTAYRGRNDRYKPGLVRQSSSQTSVATSNGDWQCVARNEAPERIGISESVSKG